jgi:hypothetical protein
MLFGLIGFPGNENQKAASEVELGRDSPELGI